MDTVTRTAVLDAPIERVWQAITEGDALAAWLDSSVDIDVRPGGVGRVGSRSVLVTEVDDGRHLSMLWWDEADGVVTSVDFTISPLVTGTEFTVTERLTGGPVASLRWGGACARLSSMVAPVYA